MRKFLIPCTFLVLLHFTSCNSDTAASDDPISTDSAAIAKGRVAFMQNCSTCHNFRNDGIGPQLAGLTDQVPVDWIRNFIRNPGKMIESGDERSQGLFTKFKAVMPSFEDLTDEEMNDVIAFLNTRKVRRRREKRDPNALSGPIAEPIRQSGLVVGLKLVAQFPSTSANGKKPLARITKLDFHPGTGDLFVLDLRGKLYRMQSNVPSVYMDLAKLRPALIHESGLGTGFGSFAFHPDFARNGIMYTAHAEAAGAAKADFSYADSLKVALQWVLSEWKCDDPGAATFSGKGRELFRADMATVAHGVQEISFNPTSRPGDKDYGMLYVTVGDGGSAEEGYPFLTHSKERIWGTILRIDPMGKNSANGKYGIPMDNPFAKPESTRTLREIYAYGFRNPHRITWSSSGEMFASNIGGNNIESINLILPGHDYGWPIREGTFVTNPHGDLANVYPLPANDSIYNVTYPVAQYDHSDGGWIAISGGYEYSGKDVPALAGKFVFGDIASGRLFFIEMSDVQLGIQAPISEWGISIGNTRTTLHQLGGLDLTDRADLHFGRDSQGELYILTKTDGKMYKLVPSDAI